MDADGSEAAAPERRTPERRTSFDEARYEAKLRSSTDGDQQEQPSSSVMRAAAEETAPPLDCDIGSVVQPAVPFTSSEYILTASGNKIAVNSILCGSHRIHMAGRSIIQPGVVLRGDLAVLRVGRYVSVGRGTTLRPAVKTSKAVFGYIPMTIGDYVTIGENCVIAAAAIGNNVVIGDNCVIGKRCILKDNCFVSPGTVLASDTVVPPFAAFGGVPGTCVGELYESVPLAQRRAAINLYNRFQPVAAS